VRGSRRLVSGLQEGWGIVQRVADEEYGRATNMHGTRTRLRVLLGHDAAGGVILLAAAILALILDNSPLEWLYDRLLETPVSLRVGHAGIDKPLVLWINDGLMALFFLLVGLELKRELLVGDLSTWRRAVLPLIAAVGGMVVPALIYIAINAGNPAGLRGWAIPAATDIAFAVGVLALLGPRVPASLKIFLLALAIIDDLGAIMIIALFYTQDLAPTALALALVGGAALWALNRFDVRSFVPYVLVATFMWVCVLKSGVHATLAGVALALAIPLRQTDDHPSTHASSMLERLEHGLQPWVKFLIAPLFAFANAGVSLAGLKLGNVLAPVPLGIAAGLFLGKQFGIFASTWLAVRLGLAEMPVGASWRQVFGTAALGGIGFTMSLFIGSLAFPDASSAVAVRIGVLVGSLASGVLGYALLRTAAKPAASVPVT
jgi:Na+:H+ antiporter, NhaA family